MDLEMVRRTISFAHAEPLLTCNSLT